MSETIGTYAGCEFLIERVNADSYSQPQSFAITGSRDVLYASVSDCGARVGKVSRQDAESLNPGLVERIKHCPGSYTETAEVPRKWPLGLIGLTKEVTVEKCGATDSVELEELVASAQ